MFTLEGYDIEVAKFVRDPIFHFIEIPREIKPFVDDKFIQRLRWINQLPLEQLVYPSAQHSRFEHSLGTMHLAMRAAVSLIYNSKNKLKKIFNEDKYIKGKNIKEKFKYFIIAAGLTGLLHDVGHAPFSHTLETASKFSNGNFYYNHEEYGFKISKYLLENKNHDLPDFITRIILSVLNKKLKITDLSPVEILIRNLIDNDFDIDKGDYLLRDSYHCGVNYGIYDYERLWRNIIITKYYTIGINEKGALETWKLRLARYFMYKNVYFHHTRNITDAMLIDIIIRASEKNSFKIPSLSNEKDRAEYLSWRDADFLTQLEGYNNDEIKETIDRFMSRKLYKIGFNIPLIKYQFLIDREDEIINELNKIKLELNKKDISINFNLLKDIIPPVFEEEVQEKIKVETDNKRIIPLAKYLGFGLEEEVIEKSLKSSSKKIHVFFKESEKLAEKNVKKKIEERLEYHNKKYEN